MVNVNDIKNGMTIEVDGNIYDNEGDIVGYIYILKIYCR